MQAEVAAYVEQFKDELDEHGRRLVVRNGVHLEVRLEQDKVCLLVMIGVRADGTNELIALTDGHRESSESWADLLGDCKRRGMAASVLAIGDGALGFWAALRDVFPATHEQRCWFHKIANVLNAFPKSAQPGARAALDEIWNAEDREHAGAAARSFVPSTAPSGPTRSRRSPTTSTCCWSSPTTLPSTGSTCVPRTRSSRPSPPSAFGSGSPRGPDRGRPAWRVPTNQEAISKSHDPLVRRS